MWPIQDHQQGIVQGFPRVFPRMMCDAGYLFWFVPTLLEASCVRDTLPVEQLTALFCGLAIRSIQAEQPLCDQSSHQSCGTPSKHICYMRG